MDSNPNTIKFIHTADLHLESPCKGLNHLPLPIFEKLTESTFASFHNIIEVAISENVDLLLIAGDLFDEDVRSLKAQISLRKGFEKLRDVGIQVFIIHGNHDHLGGSWAHLSWPDNVHFFGKDVEMIPFIKNERTVAHIYGFSYETRAVTANMVEHYKKIEGAQFHIGMLHGNLEGKKDHDPYAPFTIQQLLEKEFDYWALGHIHKKQMLHESPPILYPGNIQGRHRKETGEKGCFIIEMSSSKQTKQQFIPTAVIIWETEQLSIEDVEAVDGLILSLQKLKETYRARNKGIVLTIELVGRSKLYQQLNDANFLKELKELINEREEEEEYFVWVAAIANHTIPPYNRNELKQQAHFISDLLEQIDNYDEQDYEAALSILFMNRKIKGILNQNIKSEMEEVINEAEKLLLQELLKET